MFVISQTSSKGRHGFGTQYKLEHDEKIKREKAMPKVEKSSPFGACMKCSSQNLKKTGRKPKYEFDQALQETVQWYQNNPQWWEPLANEKTLHPQPWTINW